MVGCCLFVWIFFFFKQGLMLHRLGCPGTHYVVQAGLNLTESCLYFPNAEIKSNLDRVSFLLPSSISFLSSFSPVPPTFYSSAPLCLSFFPPPLLFFYILVRQERWKHSVPAHMSQLMTSCKTCYRGSNTLFWPWSACVQSYGSMKICESHWRICITFLS